MLGVPLDTSRQRRLSISSIEDNDINSGKLSAVIDEQKRTIRKLNLKIAKLEETVKKQRMEQSISKEDNSMSAGKTTHYEMLKLEIEKSGILQSTLFRIANKIDHMSVEISPKLEEDELFDQNFKALCRSADNFQHSNPERPLEYNHDLQTFLTIDRCFDQLRLLESALKNMKLIIVNLKKDNFVLKGSIQKEIQIRKKTSLDIDELRDIKAQFQDERKRCVKLKKLLEKSEYQRNSLVTSLDRISSIDNEIDGKSSEQLLKLSKKLSFKVSHLEKQKNQMLKQSLREKESWASKYKDFLKFIKQYKKC